MAVVTRNVTRNRGCREWKKSDKACGILGHGRVVQPKPCHACVVVIITTAHGGRCMAVAIRNVGVCGVERMQTGAVV